MKTSTIQKKNEALKDANEILRHYTDEVRVDVDALHALVKDLEGQNRSPVLATVATKMQEKIESLNETIAYMRCASEDAPKGREPAIPPSVAEEVIDYMDSARESVEQMVQAHIDPAGDLTGGTADWDKHLLLLVMALRVTTDAMHKVVHRATYGRDPQPEVQS